MNSSTTNLIQILRDRVDVFISEGNYNEALHAATAAVEKTQQALNSDPTSVEQFVDALELRGELYRALGRFDDAYEDYKQALDQLDGRVDRVMQIARIHAAQGDVHDCLGRFDEAAKHWRGSMKMFEEMDPPAELDIALMANNLAYLKKSQGDVDSAESYFLRALEIYHKQLGQNHEQTATVSNNLGALYHSAGYHEQAREMHIMSLEARTQLFGDNHPDTAQSHNNLALALLETGDKDYARGHFEKALSAFETLGSEYAEELDAVSSNYCGFLRDSGDSARADELEAKMNA